MAGGTFVLVTGASRGFGRALSLEFSRKVQGDLQLHLWARSAHDLQETKAQAQQTWQHRKDAQHHQLVTNALAIDLGDPADYIPKMDALLQEIKDGNFSQIYVIHNAASLGEVTFAQEWSSHQAMQQYLELNVTSVMWFNTRFLQEFGASREELTRTSPCTDELVPHCVLVNISSLWAIEPALTNGMYCTGKAAREMLHRVIALEQKPSPRIRTLNYAPGPMDTEMQSHFRLSTSVHEYIKKTFIDMKNEGSLVPPGKSAALLVDLLMHNDFESGSHADYFELTQTPRDYYK